MVMRFQSPQVYLRAVIFKKNIFFFKTLFQEYYQSIKRFGSRLVPTLVWA